MQKIIEKKFNKYFISKLSSSQNCTVLNIIWIWINYSYNKRLRLRVKGTFQQKILPIICFLGSSAGDDRKGGPQVHRGTLHRLRGADARAGTLSRWYFVLLPLTTAINLGEWGGGKAFEKIIFFAASLSCLGYR